MRDIHRWQQQYLGTTSLRGDTTRLELSAFFTFGSSVLVAIKSRYKPNLRIAAAIQLGFLAMTGRMLKSLNVIPARLLKHVSEQLEVPAPSIATLKSIYRRQRTLFEHQVWAMELLGFVRPNDRQFGRLLTHLRREAPHAKSIDELVQLGRLWLYQRSFVNPGDRPIRDFARQAYVATERVQYDAVCELIPELVRARWAQAVLAKRDGENRTVIEWLQAPPRRRSIIALRETIARVDYLKDLGVDQYELASIPLEKQRGFAQEMRAQRPARFDELNVRTRTLRLVCALRVALIDATDRAILLANRSIAKLWRQAHEKATDSESMQVVLQGRLLDEIFEQVDDPELDDQRFRESVRGIKRSHTIPKFPSRAAAVRWRLSEPGTALRSLLVQVLKLKLQGHNDDPIFRSLQALQTLYDNKTTVLPTDISVHYPRAWQPIVEGEDRSRAMHGLEAATLLELRKGLRRGALWIDHSATFRNRDQLLIPDAQWAKERNRRYTQLNVPMRPRVFLRLLCETLETKLESLVQAIGRGEISVQDGNIRVPKVTAIRRGRDVRTLRDDLFKAIGTVQFPDLILEVDSQTGFSQALLGRVAASPEELLRVYGGMLAHGTALDASGIALMIPRLEAAQIRAGMRLFEDAHAVRTANEVVVSYLRQHPVAKSWGDGSLASSDMMSFDVSKHLLSARLDPKRRVPSVGTYTHVADFWGIVNDQPIVLNERQAGAAIEGAIRQKEIDIELLAVDTHGYTNFAMAIAKLLGFDLCPRLKQLSDRKLHLPRNFDIPNELCGVTLQDISLRSIEKYWDALVRIVASIETGQTSAVVALARFGSAAIGDPIYRAGVHLGHLIRTLFLCDYFLSEDFRRLINRLVVHGEAVHQLQRAIYTGNFAKPRGHRQEELIAISGSLTLMTNLCLAWTTNKIEKVIADWRAADADEVPHDWLKSVSPAHFRNINFRGTFTFPIERYSQRVLATHTSTDSTSPI